MDLLDAMYEALHSELGVAIRVQNPVKVRAQFYSERNRRPEFLPFGIYHSSLDPQELFIIKREVLDAYRATEKTHPPTT